MALRRKETAIGCIRTRLEELQTHLDTPCSNVISVDLLEWMLQPHQARTRELMVKVCIETVNGNALAYLLTLKTVKLIDVLMAAIPYDHRELVATIASQIQLDGKQQERAMELIRTDKAVYVARELCDRGLLDPDELRKRGIVFESNGRV